MVDEDAQCLGAPFGIVLCMKNKVVPQIVDNRRWGKGPTACCAEQQESDKFISYLLSISHRKISAVCKSSYDVSIDTNLRDFGHSDCRIHCISFRLSVRVLAISLISDTW